MLTIDTDFLISGKLIQEHCEYPEDIFGRMCPIYSCVIEADEPDIRDHLDLLFDMSAGPQGAFFADQPLDRSQIRFESIIQPNICYGEDGGISVKPGDHVTIGARIEIACDDGQTDSFRVVLRSIQSFVGYDCDEVDMETVSAEEYSEFNF